MVATLSLAGSSYLAPFLQLKEQIQQEAAAAQDNVRFLACLEAPCKALSKASPPEIPGLLPQILDCIRMIWSLSRFYNTPERISGLLRRLSNEVINRCCAALRLGDIFNGDVVGPMEALQQSMAAGGLRQWRYITTGSTAAAHRKPATQRSCTLCVGCTEGD
jgi:dynein heavy chain